VRALAEQVTRDAKDPRQQARLLYEWVATNINYAGNCVGVGAVVPRDQAFVLDNRMGDCKDQATLLQALLAARGIASTQALVNSGSMYHLPKVPVVSMVNHVIVYVPGLDVYLDPTSGTTPFGMLPMGDSDKPVLLVDGYRDGVRTPPLRGGANRQVAKSEVTLKPDGSVAGVVQVSVTGAFAVSGRDRLRKLTLQQKEEFLDRMYRRDNKTGFGRLESEDPKPMLDTFSYKLTFETEEFSQMPGPGAFAISPLWATEAPIHMIVAMAEDETEAEETTCSGGTIVEEYVFRLPKGMKVLALPKNVTLASGPVTYRATYSLRGHTLTARRELVDGTDRNVCPASVQREFAKLARKIATDQCRCKRNDPGAGAPGPRAAGQFWTGNGRFLAECSKAAVVAALDLANAFQDFQPTTARSRVTLEAGRPCPDGAAWAPYRGAVVRVPRGSSFPSARAARGGAPRAPREAGCASGGACARASCGAPRGACSASAPAALRAGPWVLPQ
jgi:hypothetical protein